MPPQVAPASSPAAEGYTAFIGVSDLVAGENRFVFALVSKDGELLEGADVRVGFYRVQGERGELRAEEKAVFRQVRGVTPHQHEDGQLHEHLEVRAAYFVDRVHFDQAGVWRAEFFVAPVQGRQLSATGLNFIVQAQTNVPKPGDPVPPSRNLTVADVSSIEEICTRVPPDDMHHLTVAQALQQGKPFVVVISTPLFCTSRMCGPVTDVAVEVQGQYHDRMNFIHIEPYDLRLARTEGKLVLSEVTKEWNLPSEPWVFVVDGRGRVSARFEGLVSFEELEGAVRRVLAQ